MLLRRFGGRRRLDIVLGLFVCFGKRQRALVACRRRMVSKKRGACFFLGAFGFQLDMAFNWTIRHRKRYWEQQDRESTIVMLARNR